MKAVKIIAFILSGVITTTGITHASPAGVYAHTANRDWENDDEIKKNGGNTEECEDIARQLVYGKVGSKLNVVFGGGRENFLPKWKKDVSGGRGKRTDNINLIEQWKVTQTQQNHTRKYVQTRDELLNLPNHLDNVLGLFATSHMPFHLDADETSYPTLAEMVSKALDILENQHKQHGRGYFLFVEGGRIDHGHHYTQAIKALDETVEFNKAVELTKSRTSEEDTLIVVTADHSHTMSMSGYSSRKNDIFGVNNGQIADDELPYATLSYANGPGYEGNILLSAGGKRKNLLETNMKDKNYEFPTTVPLEYETHGGDDVAVFASGPYSHLFTGVFEQNFIPHAMGFASCIGNGLKSPTCSTIL